MSNGARDSFDSFYPSQFQLPQGSDDQAMNDLFFQEHGQDQHDLRSMSVMDFPPSAAHGVNQFLFDPSSHQSAMLSAGQPNPMLASQEQLHMRGFGEQIGSAESDGQESNVMLAYDSMSATAGGQRQPMSMPMDAASSYRFDVEQNYVSSLADLRHSLDPQSLLQTSASLESGHHLSAKRTPPLATPVVSHGGGAMSSSQSATNSVTGDSVMGKTTKSSATSSLAPSDSSLMMPPRHLSQPKPIQPKSSTSTYLALEGPTTSQNFNSELYSNAVASAPSPPSLTNIYSSSGFDIFGILSRVASRPNPKINIGAVDLSCAFALCDILQKDQPIVYVSDAFERLTGYTKDEIIGRNCRFLQGPDGHVQQGVKRNFVDDQIAFRLKSTIDERSEIQVSLINYRKGGQPFMNLITMIPIQWDSPHHRFYVGFQVDLVEKPGAITRRNPNGTFMINYQRGSLPSYMPPSDMYQVSPDLSKQLGEEEVSAILNTIGYSGSPFSKQYLDRMLIENADDVIHVLSSDCEFLYLSPSCLAVLEFEPMELVGKTLSTICHPSDIGPVIRDFHDIASAASVSVVYRIRKKYSGYMWFECHGSWHVEPGHGRQYLVLAGRERPVYCFDRISELELEADGIGENDLWAKTSLSGMLLFVSSKARPVLGRPADELIGQSVQELIGPDSKPEILRALEMAGSGRPATFSHRMFHRKGHMLEAQTTFYPGDGGGGGGNSSSSSSSSNSNSNSNGGGGSGSNIPEGEKKPSFLVAQIRPTKMSMGFNSQQALSSSSSEDDRGVMALALASPDRPPYDSSTGRGRFINDTVNANGTGSVLADPPVNQVVFYYPHHQEPKTFAELKATRGSSWQFELRELEKQNRLLYDELQTLLNRKKKRKRKAAVSATTAATTTGAGGANPADKTCAMCQVQNTPEWRRGPSGKRDLCNSCGLRWAKQVRNNAASTTSKSAARAEKERSLSSSTGST